MSLGRLVVLFVMWKAQKQQIISGDGNVSG